MKPVEDINFKVKNALKPELITKEFVEDLKKFAVIEHTVLHIKQTGIARPELIFLKHTVDGHDLVAGYLIIHPCNLIHLQEIKNQIKETHPEEEESIDKLWGLKIIDSENIDPDDAFILCESFNPKAAHPYQVAMASKKNTTPNPIPIFSRRKNTR